MPDIDGLVAEVDASPQGSEIAAFFDFDGTLIDGYSAVAYFKDRLLARDVGTNELLRSLVESVNVEVRGRDVHRLVEIGVGALAGRSVEDIDRMGERLFRKNIAQHSQLIPTPFANITWLGSTKSRVRLVVTTQKPQKGNLLDTSSPNALQQVKRYQALRVFATSALL